MKYNKLVRDKIPEYIVKKGGKPVTSIASEEEYWTKLKEKLLEEFEEFKKAENPEEIADMLEVIEAMANHKGFDMEEVGKIKLAKAEERGKFKDRIILHES